MFVVFVVLPRPSSASSRGGGQGNLSTHTVTQDFMFCLLFFLVHVILFSLCHAFFSKALPPPHGTVGCATFPFRVGFRLLSRPPRHDGSLREAFDFGFPCLRACVLFQLAFFRLAPPPR